jgi:hypothetical protein
MRRSRLPCCEILAWLLYRQDRPADRTDVAKFYVISAVQVYNPAARQVSAVQGKTLSQNARIFALISMAVSDGLVSSMETKYFYNRWRPVTAIRAGDTDGNPRIVPDPNWLPLITTPPFPSYPSARDRAGGAARGAFILDNKLRPVNNSETDEP